MINSQEIFKQPKPTKEKKSILIIDDSPEMLEIGKIVLEIDGFKVLTANGGAEALRILAETSAPDLILLDMQMEDMSGFDFLKILEDKNPEIIEDVPIVFLTGMEPDQIPISKAAGFMRKARDLNLFLQDVHRYIEMGPHTPYTH